MRMPIRSPLVGDCRHEHVRHGAQQAEARTLAQKMTLVKLSRLKQALLEQVGEHWLSLFQRGLRCSETKLISCRPHMRAGLLLALLPAAAASQHVFVRALPRTRSRLPRHSATDAISNAIKRCWVRCHATSA